jgi:DNA-binding transcriptional LysR family regulator
MLELRHLRYFLAVAEERSFSRAAQRLHMAQSPLSAAIRQLEQEIGSELLSRGSRGVTLTPAGDVLLDRGRRILENVDGAVAAARRAAAGQLGALRAGFSWSARFATLPVLGQRFAERFPEVMLITQEMWNADMPRALRSGTIDLAISVCAERDVELDSEVIRREPVVVLLPARHRLADEHQIGLADLADEAFLMFPRELAPRLHDVLLALCERAGFEPKISRWPFHSAGDTGTFASADAVALVPESVRGGVPGTVAVSVSEPQATLETALVWHPPTLSAAADKFRELGRSAFARPLSKPNA